jgi:small conductance mechanosensitive channel
MQNEANVAQEAAETAEAAAETAQQAAEQTDAATGGGGGGNGLDLENIDWGVVVQEYLIPAVGVLVFLLIAWLIASLLGRITGKAMERAKVDLTLSRFAGRAVRWAVLLFALLGALGYVGIDVLAFGAVLGAAGLAIGLAFQGSLSNVAAGVMLLLFRPFRVDQVVNVAGNLGKVYEIELFTTTLDTFDNRRIIIPNSNVFGSVIENITYHPKRRVDIAVGTEYSADVDRTREVLEAAAQRIPGILTEDAPAVVLQGLGASSVDWEVRVWANTPDWLAVKQAGIREVKKALDDAGIGIPFPQMDVHLDKVGE